MNRVYLNKDPASEVFEMLICQILRGGHIHTMDANQLQEYIYKAGVVLHNIPHFIICKEPLSYDILKGINDLDPSSKKGRFIKKKCWGDWVSLLVPHLVPELPEYR